MTEQSSDIKITEL